MIFNDEKSSEKLAKNRLELQVSLELFIYDILKVKKKISQKTAYDDVLILENDDLEKKDLKMHMPLKDIIIATFIRCEFYTEANNLIDIWGIPSYINDQVKAIFIYQLISDSSFSSLYSMKTPLVAATLNSMFSKEAHNLALRMILPRTFSYKIETDILVSYQAALHIGNTIICKAIETIYPSINH